VTLQAQEVGLGPEKKSHQGAGGRDGDAASPSRGAGAGSALCPPGHMPREDRCDEQDGSESRATAAGGQGSPGADGPQEEGFPWGRCLRTCFFIGVWYVLSTCLTLYNKLLLSKDDNLLDQGPFPAPLFMTGVQFAFQALWCRGILWWSGSLGALNRPWEEYKRAVLPNGLATGLDIGLSNLSLVFITTSFYTMCKSSSPLFLLLFAFVFRLERPSWDLAGVVSIIFVGLLLLVFGESRFNLTGFVCVMAAACLSGLRWTLTQILLQGGAGGATGRDSKSHGPVAVVGSLTPVMSLTVLVCSLVLETLWNRLPGSPWFQDMGTTLMTIGVIKVGAVIAVAMVTAEFRVIQETDALTLMVAGSFKELLTVAAGVAVFDDPFGVTNAVGIGILIFGVALFNLRKYRQMKQASATDRYALAEGTDQDLECNDDIGETQWRERRLAHELATAATFADRSLLDSTVREAELPCLAPIWAGNGKTDDVGRTGEMEAGMAGARHRDGHQIGDEGLASSAS